jgi:sortase A
MRVRIRLRPVAIARTILLVAAIGCLGYYAWSTIGSTLRQEQESRAFDQARESAHSTPSRPPSARSAPGVSQTLAPIGRISVPRLRLRAMIEEGDDDDTLSHAVGHVPGTALPGSSGNVAVAGHRDTFFRGLGDLKRNDEIDVDTLNGTYRYRVDQISVVDPSNTSVLASTYRKTLTLITCFPFHYIGPAPRRFIVQATQISAGPSSPAARKSVASRAARSRPESERCPRADNCAAADLR